MERYKQLVAGVIIGFFLGMIIIWGISELNSPVKINELLELTGKSTRIEVGTPAPNFSLDSLTGDRVNLEDFQGKIVIINFWATWCAPCRLEMPLLEQLYVNEPDDTIVLGINSQDSKENIQEFITEYQLSFPILLDQDESIHSQYMVLGLPTSYIIDRDGLLQYKHIGILSEDQLVDYLTELGLETNL